MKRQINATLWNDLHPDDPPRYGLIILDAPSKAGDGSQYVACGGEDSERLNETARRIVALWNAAEDLGLTTEKIAEGEIQSAFHERDGLKIAQGMLDECFAHKVKQGEEIKRLEKEVKYRYDIRLVDCPQCGYKPRETDTMTVSGDVVRDIFQTRSEKRHAEHSLSIALERIEKLEAEKAESEHALGFAVEAVERLEAEKVALLEALEYAINQVPELASVPGIETAIEKARGEE